MGLVRWLQESACLDGEPAVDRTRKAMLVPFTLLGGTFSLLWATGAWVGFLPELADSAPQDRLRKILLMTCGAFFVAGTLPAGLYVLCTRRISRGLCEVTGIILAAGIIVQDMALALYTERSYVLLIVIILDMLLVCSCRHAVAKAVVVTTIVWMQVRGAMDAENVSGTCAHCYTRFSLDYIRSAMAGSFIAILVFVLDFHFTRGFATSMTEQKALVEASVRVSEAAAVLLSKYQTDATRELLEGPDGEQLPPLLRSALRQLVDNLALYRPYLPQSCMPDDAGGDNRSTEDEGGGGGGGGGGGVEDTAAVPVEANSESGRASIGSASLSSRSHVPPASLGRLAASLDAAQRKVSLIAVNSKSFLRSCVDKHAAMMYVRAEVDEFLGAVAAERGVVDIVSGDHLFANFNASRLCTTHRVSAARVTWGMAGPGEGAVARRSAAVCSGGVMCGDFGTSEMRRFMVLGAAFNTLQCLERVAAQLGTVLVDEAVGADADFGSNFFSALVERLLFAKRGAKPFLVWQLTGRRAEGSSVDEWMYELEKQEPNPHAAWNDKLHAWLHSDAQFAESDLEGMPRPFDGAALTGARRQVYLHEAGVGGGTVAFGGAGDVCLESV